MVAITNPPNRHYPRILASQNFSGLIVLQTLKLNDCGIETIFDYVGRTLRFLDLSNNPIIHLDLSIFWIFINSRYRERELSNYKMFFFENTLVECDCDFYKVRNITAISFESYFYEYVKFSCKAAVKDWLNVRICDGNQMMYPKSCCLDHPNINVYAFPYFEIKFSGADVTLHINQAKPRQYRLWIQVIDNLPVRRKRNCPDREWIQRSSNCLMFSNLRETIDIRYILHRSETNMFCVMYLSHSKSVWPLHCIVIRNNLIYEMSKTLAGNVFIIPITFALLGLIIGSCGGLIKESYQIRRLERADICNDYEAPAGFTGNYETNEQHGNEYIEIIP